MRRTTVWVGILFIVTVLGGCPLLLDGSRTFTSADIGGGDYFGNGAEGAEGGGPATDDGAGERDVVEPDVIRREGNLLFILNQFRGLSIVDLDDDVLLAQVPVLGAPRDLYFSGGLAYVLVDNAPAVTEDDGQLSVDVASRLFAVDISDPAAPSIQSEIPLDGSLVDSRLVGGILYAVTADYTYGYYDGSGEIADSTFRQSMDTTTVTSIDVSNPAAMTVVDSLAFTGTGQVIHVNNEAAFIATNNWASNATSIVYLDISDGEGALRQVGTMQVRGYVGDRFKLDAWNGALRVVSSDWSGGNQVYVTTFDLADPALTRLAETRIEGAEGETLFATRFDGARAYVVTFLIVDPLFVLDLSDPASPQVLGALEVPGYSTHIEPRGDRLIALGVDDTDGRQVSVSIFDVSGNSAPTLLDRVNFGENWSWSSAYSDVKALTILDNVIMVPFSGWRDGSGGFDRLQFISYGNDDLTLRGSVDLSGTILRSFEYGVDYFGVTTEQLSRIEGTDLDSPEVTSSVILAENLVDFIPVDQGLSVEVVSRPSENAMVVRAVDASESIRGELVVEGGSYGNAWLHDGALILLGLQWDGEPAYIVSRIDLSNPRTPALSGQAKIAVYPYFGYYGIDIYGGGGFPEVGVAASDAIGYPYYYGPVGQSSFLLGDTLALRCYAEGYDRVIGDATPYQGLALVDLTSLSLVETVGLGYERITTLDARGGNLYLGTKESIAGPAFNPTVACYIQELDVARGVEGPSVNVPGTFLDYDADEDLLVLLDYQWRVDGDYYLRLKTVRWAGDAVVSTLETEALPGYSYNHRASEGRVYFERYDDGNVLQQVSVGAGGQMTLGRALDYGPVYSYLVGVSGDHAFVNIGSSAIAHFQFEQGTGALVDYVQAGGYPSTLRRGPEGFYLPLGYHGLVTFTR